MSGFEKYVEPAATAIDPAAFDQSLENYAGPVRQFRRDKASDQARAMLAVVGPLIAEETRVRMVEAAGRALERAPFATHYEWQPVQLVGTPIWHPCAGKDQLVGKLERFGGRGRMRFVGDWDEFPDIEKAS